MKYLKPDELCELFQIKKDKLYKLTSRKTIPFFKIGNQLRFSLDEVNKVFKVDAKERRVLL